MILSKFFVTAHNFPEQATFISQLIYAGKDLREKIGIAKQNDKKCGRKFHLETICSGGSYETRVYSKLRPKDKSFK